MLCRKCGKEIDDNTVFCPSCGTPTEEAGDKDVNVMKDGLPDKDTIIDPPAAPGQPPAPQPPAPYQFGGGAAPRPQIDTEALKGAGQELLAYARSLIAPQDPAEPKLGASPIWAILCAVNVLLASVAVPVFVIECIPKDYREYIPVPFMRILIAVFFAGLLFAALVYGLSLADVLFLRKKTVSPFEALNSLVVVSLPVPAVCILCMLIGSFSPAAAAGLAVIAFIWMTVARADALRRLCDFPKAPLIDAVVIHAAGLIAFILVMRPMIEDIVRDLLGDFSIF